MGKEMESEALPKGFRFRPTDEELVSHYLRLKINGRHSAVHVIPEVDVCKWEPWDLPALSVIKSSDPEWFFFCPRDKKYPNGHRSNRATEAGYWKATGKDRTIKSRKGRSNPHLIGMKKTLVFHRGRAPKGERTNWIMHEYRATEPDLDGTGPGQGDYVLCRLFHKADDKLDKSKYDEVEYNESFISTDKSSPDDVASDLFGELAMMDMPILKELDDVKMWWTDQTDCISPVNQVPVESCASYGVDFSVEDTTMEVCEPKREVLMYEEGYIQFDDKVFVALQPPSYANLAACIGSPFADDFGSEQNGSHFQDGTSEQDASLSELLEGLQNRSNYSFENKQNDRILTRETYGAQGQTSPSSFAVPPSTDHSQSRYAFEEVESSGSVVGGTCAFYHSNQDDVIPHPETGIKIRSRKPRDRPIIVNSTIQGTAPRRIRMWTNCRVRRICCENSQDEEDESQSLTSQATKDIDRTSKSKECRILSENKESAQECDPTLAVKCSQSRSAKTTSFLRKYAVSIYIVMILLVVLLGMWLYPRFHLLHV